MSVVTTKVGLGEAIKLANEVRRNGVSPTHVQSAAQVFQPFVSQVGQNGPNPLAGRVTVGTGQNAALQPASQKATHCFCCFCCCVCDYSNGQQATTAPAAPAQERMPEPVGRATIELPPVNPELTPDG